MRDFRTSHECRARKGTKAAPDGREDEAPHLRKVAMSAQRDDVARSRGRRQVGKQTSETVRHRRAESRGNTIRMLASPPALTSPPLRHAAIPPSALGR